MNPLWCGYDDVGYAHPKDSLGNIMSRTSGSQEKKSFCFGIAWKSQKRSIGSSC